jgi:two-component system OmpR family response regulator
MSILQEFSSLRQGPVLFYGSDRPPRAAKEADLFGAPNRSGHGGAMRILVVDDEPLVAEALAGAVDSQGYEVEIAYSGVQCLTLIERNRPDGVFLDIMMPEMAGIDVLRAIRERWPDLQVVLITGFPYSPDIAEARRLGVSGVIEKPTVIRHLAAVLAGLKRSSG